MPTMGKVAAVELSVGSADSSADSAQLHGGVSLRLFWVFSSDAADSEVSSNRSLRPAHQVIVCSIPSGQDDLNPLM